MNRECNVTKRVLTRNGLRYCPVVLSANGRIKPNWVYVTCDTGNLSRSFTLKAPTILSGARMVGGRIAHPWTIASLADQVGISRSALVERFTRYLSEPPMAYLTRWRPQLAARSLERASRGVAEIAGDVGYESEAAFNRAFKREFGLPPGRYRSDHKQRLVTYPGNGQGGRERTL